MTRNAFFSRRSAMLGTIAAVALFSAPVLAQQSVTYVGWSHDEAASKPVITGMLDAYQKANPGVKLEVIGFPWAQMQQNLILRYRSKQKTDVVQIQERWLPSFAAMKSLVDLDQVYTRKALEARIDPGLLELGRIGGVQVGLPWTAGSIGMVANKKVLADAGIAEAPKTVEQFTAALRAIKKAKPNAVPFAMTTKNNASMSPDFQVWLWTFGGQLLDSNGAVMVDSGEARKALTYLTELVKEGLAAKDIDRPDARRLYAQFDAGFYADAPLARGFARNNSGKGTEYDQYVLAAPTPVLRSSDAPKSVMWGHTLGLFNLEGTPKADSASVKLIDTLLSDDSQLAYFKEVGLFPVTKSALDKVKDDAYVIDWTKNASTASRDEASNWPNAADITNIVGEEVQAAYLGVKTPDKAITDMAARLEVKMKEVR